MKRREGKKEGDIERGIQNSVANSFLPLHSTQHNTSLLSSGKTPIVYRKHIVVHLGRELLGEEI